MFVKTSWRIYKGKRYVQHHLAEAYRDPETRKPRHRSILNLSALPSHVIDAMKQALQTGEAASGIPIKLETGDALRGAGLLSIYRSWRQEGFDEVLSDLTDAERQSLLAMVAQRILQPGSKLRLQRQFEDTLLGQTFSAQRLNEDELYRVMDVLHERFYTVQERLQARHGAVPILCLYDITSTYFEGTHAEEGAYGHSRDKRWDRYQVVIGLVCNEEGVPLAVEVWPGNTADKSTVVRRVQALRERFGIEKAVFVGDAGMYSETNIEEIEEVGFHYILRTEWQTQRKQLEKLTPTQLELFDRQNVVEWVEDGARYVVCLSDMKRARAARRREQGMESAQAELARLAQTAAKGKYYSWTRLREKVNEILADAKVKGLWRTEIRYLGEEADSPETKALLQLTATPDDEAIEAHKRREGMYVLQTSTASEDYTPTEVEEGYRRLQHAPNDPFVTSRVI